MKTNVLLSLVRTGIFTIFRDIIALNTLKEIRYLDLFKKSKEHFSICFSDVVVRFNFRK